MNTWTKTSSGMLVAALLSISTSTSIAGGSHDHKHDNDANGKRVETVFGIYDPNMKPTRVVDVVMRDNMRFSPDLIKVKKGEVIKFRHANYGSLMHEFILGTPISLDEHAKMMRKSPNMEHNKPYMAHVAPGESATLIWKFSKTGQFTFACLVPGHYEAGMKGIVIVES